MKRPDPARGSTAPTVKQILDQDLETTVLGLPTEFFTKIERFAQVLRTWGARTNLTAHPDNPGEVAFHVIDSLAPLKYPELRAALRGKVLDLGSGAGFPGLILAAALPDAQFVLVEERRKRASFLSVAVAEMKLANVEVQARRASGKSEPRIFDVVTSRAVGMAALAIAAAALRPGGVGIFWITPGQRFDDFKAHAGELDVPRYLDYLVSRAGQRVPRRLVLLPRLRLS